jgi:hypothetical protein
MSAFRLLKSSDRLRQTQPIYEFNNKLSSDSFNDKNVVNSNIPHYVSINKAKKGCISNYYRQYFQILQNENVLIMNG